MRFCEASLGSKIAGGGRQRTVHCNLISSTSVRHQMCGLDQPSFMVIQASALCYRFPRPFARPGRSCTRGRNDSVVQHSAMVVRRRQIAP